MKRRGFLFAGSAAALLAGCAPMQPRHDAEFVRGPAATGTLRRIGFSSCRDQARPQPVWDTVLADRPGLFIFGGDNVYASEQPWKLERLEQAYSKQAAVPGFARLRPTVPHLAIWDDHDYGLNDGGAECQHKAASKAAFMRFWNVSPADPRQTREGLYHAQERRGDLSRGVENVPYPLYELTSSGITHPWKDAAEAGPNRNGELLTEIHYGAVEIDWEARSLQLALKDIHGGARRRQLIRINELQVHA